MANTPMAQNNMLGHDWTIKNNTLEKTFKTTDPTGFTTDVHTVGELLGHPIKEIQQASPNAVTVVLQTAGSPPQVSQKDHSIAFSIDALSRKYKDLAPFTEASTRRKLIAGLLAEDGFPNKLAFLNKKQTKGLFTLLSGLEAKGLQVEASLLRAAQKAPHTETLGSPEVRIAPGLGAEIQDAIDRIKKEVDPNYFVNVSKIDVLTGGPFGQVTSDDPAVVKVNLNRVKQEVKRQLDQRLNQHGVQFDHSDPEHMKIFDEVLTRALIEVVSHEKGHVEDFRAKQGPNGEFLGGDFPGGEAAAESEAAKVKQITDRNHPLPI